GVTMQLQGWGRYPQVDARLIEPSSSSTAIATIKAQGPQDSLIARGAGRSYGDSALNSCVLGSRLLDNFKALDTESGILHCGAGLTFDQLLQVSIPQGLFPSVVPGTKGVSIGGAIATDIHGKNHHQDGSFCDYVDSFTLLLANGECKICSPRKNRELFHATCGGMGLTGIILDATVKLEKVSSVSIRSRSVSTHNLAHTIEQLECLNSNRFVVAWIDCLASGPKLGRGIIHVGNFHETGPLKYQSRRGHAVPFSMPAILLNRYSMKLFNKLYSRMNNKAKADTVQDYDSFFFPLDRIKHWNRLYGRRGFLQYQILLPLDSAQEGLQSLLETAASAGKGSFLAVLKKFGESNRNILSFPGPGLTLALDFKREASLFPLLNELDRIVIDHGGRHYLAKDSRLDESVFKAGYPQWKKFKALKEKVDPTQCFSSLQSHRIGLTAKPGSVTS
ncbi:MAG: FAD-binding oxidoreductase, partial [Gammaproteobacteria bacterium]|nr:FAD-binding oxidoreductase [Gammaproteobacteria bacterium]